jgi:nitroimidazol reductase NimA-like FMN-containing flavoprotein (pyridoxamine 5'-phosphate oxidase superfamily)
MAKKRRRPSKLSKHAADLVARERVCRVATVSEAGQPHLVPVCHVVDGGKIYIGSGDDATKVRGSPWRSTCIPITGRR